MPASFTISGWVEAPSSIHLSGSPPASRCCRRFTTHVSGSWQSANETISAVEIESDGSLRRRRHARENTASGVASSPGWLVAVGTPKARKPAAVSLTPSLARHSTATSPKDAGLVILASLSNAALAGFHQFLDPGCERRDLLPLILAPQAVAKAGSGNASFRSGLSSISSGLREPANASLNTSLTI